MMRALRRTPSRRDDRGAASLEFVVYLPVALVFLYVTFQVCAIMWALSSINEAARQGARAQSLGQDGCAAAAGSLSRYLDYDPRTDCRASGNDRMGTPSSVEITVRTPVPALIRDWMPRGEDLNLTRTAYLP